jgi:hypothetical protein
MFAPGDKLGSVPACASCPFYPQQQTSSDRPSMSVSVESRMGAVAWAIRQRSVSHPRSSNRTCPIKASGSPTSFTVRHSAGPLGAGVRDAADRVVHRQRRGRTGVCHVLPLCAVWRGSRARAHKRIGQRCGMPIGESHGGSSSTSQAESCSACRALQAMERCCQAPADCRPSS